MRIVLDTNILLVSASPKSESYWLFDLLRKRKFELAYTTEILAEYEEQFSKHWSLQAAETLIAILLELHNAVPTIIYYHLRLIGIDEDDNKFVDCAFASNADYIVTEDHHFSVLKTLSFPTIQPISLQEFKQILIERNLLTP